MTHPFIYPYLEYAIRYKKVKLCDIAAHLGISHNSLSRKLHGKQTLRIDEAFAIRQFLNVNVSIDKLFMEIGKTKTGREINGHIA